MAKEARELEAFFNQSGRPDLANRAGKLAVEAKKLEDRNEGLLDVRQPQIELPKGIRTETLRAEAMTKGDFVEGFRQKGIEVTSYTQDLIDRVELTGKPQDLTLAWPSGRDLGLRQAVPYRRFLEAGQSGGYNLVPPEVGLYLRLQDINQPLGDLYWMAMDPITDRYGGRPRVFALGHDSRGLWLGARWTLPVYVWDPEDRLVFSLSK